MKIMSFMSNFKNVAQSKCYNYYELTHFTLYTKNSIFWPTPPVAQHKFFGPLPLHIIQISFSTPLQNLIN